MISENSKKNCSENADNRETHERIMYPAQRPVTGQAREQRRCAECAMRSAAGREVRRIYSVWDGTGLPKYCIATEIR